MAGSPVSRAQDLANGVMELGAELEARNRYLASVQEDLTRANDRCAELADCYELEKERAERYREELLSFVTDPNIRALRIAGSLFKGEMKKLLCDLADAFDAVSRLLAEEPSNGGTEKTLAND